jgi:hypothetical protein
MFLVLMLACTGGGKEDSSNAPPINQDDSVEKVCEGGYPTVTELTVTDAGELTVDAGTFSSFAVSATAEDDDGDLHVISMDLWWDEVVDGEVSTSGAAGISSGAYRDPDWEDCEVFVTTFGLQIPVDGVRFLGNTAYEFAAVVHDANGMLSSPKVASGTTPEEL